MAKRQTLTESLRKDAIALAVLGVIGLLAFIDSHPIEFSASEPEVTGAAPPPTTLACDTMLVLPDLPEEPAQSFSTMDMAYGWFNILGQEIGCFKHVTASRIAPTAWTSSRLLVVSAAGGRALRQDQIDGIGRWVEQGGLVLVEQPDARWNASTGIAMTGAPPRVTRRLTAANNSPMRGAIRDSLLNTPITTTMLTADLSGKGASVLLEADGRPALIHAKRGSGHVYALTIDLARAIMTLQQGRPLDDFSLPPLEDAPYVPEDKTQPWVMVADKKLLDNAVPYADLLERIVIEVTAQHIPLPRLWYFPGKHNGVFIMSHDEEAFGDKASFVTDWERAEGHRSTNFIIPDSMSPDALQAMLDQDHDVQVHWNRGFGENHPLQTRPAGIAFFEPLKLELSLAEQIAAISGSLEGRAVTLNRIHGLVWDRDWASNFGKMAAAQLVADSSYGPTGPKQFGYLFGTGRPFYPLDRSGLLIPILEVPFVLQDDENLDQKRLRELIVRSEAGHHQVIMPIFHSNTMANKPDVEVMTVWRWAFGFARRHKHWVTTLRDYLLFEEARRTTAMRSRFFPTERRLEVELDVQSPRIELKPDAKDPLPVPSLAFPQTHDGNSVESVTIDGEAASLRRLGRSGDGFYHIASLTPGKHTVHIVYGGKVINPLSPED